MEESEKFIDSVDALLAQENKQIPVDLSLEESFIQFFRNAKEVIKKNQIYSQQRNKIDYLLMKRFLFTAFNNLVEMDLTIGRGRVNKPYKKLKEVEKEYELIRRARRKPIIEIYDKIFLTKQISYQYIVQDLETIKKLIGMYEIKLDSLSKTLEILKIEIETIDKTTEAYEEKLSMFRKTNTDYTDSIQYLNENKSKLEEGARIVEEFEKTFVEEFKKKFIKDIDSVIEEMIVVLNGLSYTFDQILWEEARESVPVKQFFEKARIQGSFSSKTYLYYFIKNLDEKSSNEEHKKLKELYEYLKSTSSKHICLICRDSDDMEKNKFLLEKIDKDFHVQTGTDPDMIFVHYKRKPFHLLIIDDDIRGGDFIDVIEEFWQTFQFAKRDVSILIRFHNPQYDDIIRAGKIGIKNFMFKNNDEKELTAKVREII